MLKFAFLINFPPTVRQNKRPSTPNISLSVFFSDHLFTYNWSSSEFANLFSRLNDQKECSQVESALKDQGKYNSKNIKGTKKARKIMAEKGTHECIIGAIIQNHHNFFKFSIEIALNGDKFTSQSV